MVQNPLARPRIPHELLFVCGGWSGGSPTAAVEIYDVRFLMNRLKQKPHMNTIQTRADRWFQLPYIDKRKLVVQTPTNIFIIF